MKRFANCTVYIYGEDHNPPHVHIRGPDFLLLVEIGGKGRIIGRTGKARDVEEAIAWIKANTAMLLDLWKDLNP
ncbi:DUF4160 domain-containing protein [Azospirillum sp.]|uniref:DUF4160 domain-containing protein n=1 Tax=Azospirillum sp. TaxID=34012 RepID=UPI003D70B681